MWKETTAKPHSLREKCRSISFTKPKRRHTPGWICESLFLCGLMQPRQYISLGLHQSARMKVSRRCEEPSMELDGGSEVRGRELWSLTPRRNVCFSSCLPLCLSRCLPLFWARLNTFSPAASYWPSWNLSECDYRVVSECQSYSWRKACTTSAWMPPCPSPKDRG